jgi:hypothetical protein
MRILDFMLLTCSKSGWQSISSTWRKYLYFRVTKYYLLAMSNLHSVLVLILLTLSPNIVIADLFGSESYEDCILENMEGVESDVAARAVKSACRTKTAAEPKSEPDYDNTCDFIFDPKNNRFNRIATANRETLIKDHNRHLFVRDGVTQQELDVAEDLFKKADREKATNARAIALLFMKLLKFVYFPVEIPKEYIETQADRVPYCSR